MRISAEAVNEARQKEERRVDEQKTSDRFSQLLKSKDDKSEAKQAGIAGDADARQNTPATSLTAASGNLVPNVDASSAHLSLASGATDANKIAQPGASMPAQMDRLNTEIAHQIDIFKQEGGAQAVNITFDS